MGKMKDTEIEMIEGLINLVRSNKAMLLDLNCNPVNPDLFDDNELFTRIQNDEFLFQSPQFN